MPSTLVTCQLSLQTVLHAGPSCVEEAKMPALKRGRSQVTIPKPDASQADWVRPEPAPHISPGDRSRGNPGSAGWSWASPGSP